MKIKNGILLSLVAIVFGFAAQSAMLTFSIPVRALVAGLACGVGAYIAILLSQRNS